MHWHCSKADQKLNQQVQYLSGLGLCENKQVCHHWYRIWSHLPVCCINGRLTPESVQVPLLYIPSSRQRSCLKRLWWQAVFSVTVFVQGRSCVRPWVCKMLMCASGCIIGRIMKVTRDREWVSDSSARCGKINLLKPTGYVMHQQIWHSRNVHSADIVFMCFIFISEQTATCATYNVNWSL
jgi:hypothetical protein